MVSPYRSESEETDRLLALSDGVIAIVITLLVLDITVPRAASGTPTAVLPRLVAGQWAEFLAFALSFLVIGFYWVLHRRIFVHVERHDRGVLYLNLLVLLAIAFVPYATSVFTTYPNRFGVAFLSGVLALTGFSLTGLWLYVSRRDLLEAGLTSRTVGIQALRFLASPLVFVLAAVVAQVDAALAMGCWLLLLPINGALQSRLVDSLEASTPS
jgi:uncharacterized membrane protein